jgi:CPA2 family monovalent cation:H+ antiporter-2
MAYFGDATNAAFMRTCGITEAAAVIVTIGSESSVDTIVLGVRHITSDVLIVARKGYGTCPASLCDWSNRCRA